MRNQISFQSKKILIKMNFLFFLIFILFSVCNILYCMVMISCLHVFPFNISYSIIDYAWKNLVIYILTGFPRVAPG